jgi:hypothetical protein
VEKREERARARLFLALLRSRRPTTTMEKKNTTKINRKNNK